MTQYDELNRLRDKIINDYRKKAELRFSEYETSSTEHCRYFQKYIAEPPAHILDIGSGSGRDAAYYSEQGYKITAVEPAAELRELARQKYGHLDITWLEDRLPDLAVLQSAKILFDHVHMNAVIFHLPKEYTKDVIISVSKLLKPEGTFYVSVRNGPTDPERPMFDVTKEHVIAEAAGLFELIDSTYKPDSRNRPGINWDRLIFRKI